MVCHDSSIIDDCGAKETAVRTAVLKNETFRQPRRSIGNARTNNFILGSRLMVFSVLTVGFTGTADPEMCSAQCPGTPQFRWVGSNGAPDGGEASEGRRNGIDCTDDGSIVIADWHQEVEADWDPTSDVRLATTVGDHDFSIARVTLRGSLSWMFSIGDYLADEVDSVQVYGETVGYAGAFGWDL